MTISAEERTLARKVEAMSARPGARRTAEVRRLLDSMTTRGDPSNVFIDDFAGPLTGGILGSSALPESLYKPSGSTSPMVLAGHSYTDTLTVPSPFDGSASASTVTGRLASLTLATLGANDDSSWAGVYVRLSTNAPTYGSVNRVRVEPEVAWAGSGKVHIDAPWGANVAGTAHIYGRIWVDTRVLNVATGMWETLVNGGSRSWTVFHHSMTGLGTIPFSYSGGMPGVFEFIADPARIYLVGVLIQVRSLHNLTPATTAIKTLSPPPTGQFVTYGLLNAVVPRIWITHTVLA
jgi:hypothetical protein